MTGPMKNTKTEIKWDHEWPRYVIVIPQHRDDVLDFAQMLMEYIGEVKGFNVRIVTVGQNIRGSVFDEYISYGCTMPTGDPKTMTKKVFREWDWWMSMLNVAVRGGLTHV